MNLEELILNKNQLAPFIITILLTWGLYKFLNRYYNISNNNIIAFPVLLCIIYVVFLIVYRIVNTDTNFSKPLVNYIITKKNFKEEPYQINYINPFITNLDKVDFNMKKSTNKKYIKRILNELLIRKYVQFENVLAYNKDPWKIIKLTEKGDQINYSTEDDGDIKIKDNKYCKNYLEEKFKIPASDTSSTGNAEGAAKKYIENSQKQCLILYRKYIIQFEKKLYFIFEKKNKKDSKYYLNECISQVVINSNEDYYSIIDTRDLYYDRQYIVFIDFPISGDKTKKQWGRPTPRGNVNDGYKSIRLNNTVAGKTRALKNTIGDTPDNKVKVYTKFLDTPIEYYWQNDHPIINIQTNTSEYSKNIVDTWRNIYVIDIFFIYNDMVILDETRNIENSMDKTDGNAENTADFSLNKYYNKRDWIIKRYYNFIRNQFNGRVLEKNLNVYLNNTINDISTIKFRNIVGKNTFDTENVNIMIYINKKNLDRSYTNEIILYENSDKNKEIKINFEEYIKKYIQNKDVEPGELVIIKDKKNTKYDKNNSLVVDKSTINYVSFNFLNIKKAEEMKKGDGRKEYARRMNYIADEILKKYFDSQLKSIDKIKYNVETLQIIQLDSLFRYNKGRNRLVLNGRIITPNNIGTYFKDISRLRESYKTFLEQTLQYKAKLNESIEENKFDLNVSNIKLLEILNTNSFNTKSKFIAIIDKISHSEETRKDFTTEQDTDPNLKVLNTQTADKNYNKSIIFGLNNKLVKLHISQKQNGYRKSSSIPLFVKFNAIVNINGFNINPNNVYVIHRIQKNATLNPTAIYLENYLLEPDINNNKTKVMPITEGTKLLKNLKLYDCTNTFRKETIGVANIIELLSENRFKISFDNVPLEFKKLIGGDTESRGGDIYIDEPIFVMLNVSKINTIGEIQKNIYENQLYRVEKVESTSLNSSASITVISNYKLDIDSEDEEVNFIFKDILVSQFINSKNYIENVYFKKVEIPPEDRALSSSPSISYQIALKKQIITIEPPITRMEITSSKEKYIELMNRIINYIYENEAKKIHYEIPEDIGIYKDTTAAVYSYKYKNELYVSYDKRNNPINYFKNTNSQYLCRKKYDGNTYFMNINALYNLDSFNKYYIYFKNMFKNIIGLHDEINNQCNEYFKSGRMIDKLKVPITFNKYVTFSTNFMLYYKDQQLLDDIDPSLIGKHIVINNNVLDNNLLNINNSNRNNSNIYRTFIRDIIYTHNIGAKGFEYDDAKKICERIYTVYDKKCDKEVPTYKIQGEDYNLAFYKNNKKRDECFNIVYNTQKEMNNEQFIAKIKGFDPTVEGNNIENNSKHDLHIDPIPNHSFYKLSKTLSTTTSSPLITLNATKGSNYEKYTWLRNMIDKKGDIVVGNLNNNYYKIEQSQKDQNTIKEKQAQPTDLTTTPPTIGTPSGVTTGIKVKPNYAGAPNATQTNDHLFRFALDYEGYEISKDPDSKLAAPTTFTLADVTTLDKKTSNLASMYYQIAGKIHIPREKKEKWLQEKINKFGDIIILKVTSSSGTPKYNVYKISSAPPKEEFIFTHRIKLTPVLKNNSREILDLPTNVWPGTTTIVGNYRFYKGQYNLKNIKDKLEQNKWKTDNEEAVEEYEKQIKALEKIGNIEVKPHRLAELNEIKTAAYYNAEWDNIAWINDNNPLIYNKSNLIRVKDKKVLWFDKNDPNAKNKGVVCYGRKLDQNKLAQNKKNELFNFQMEKIEQNIKDLQKYENVSKFNKEVYSRWNL
tara:strand:- start:19400 stop:24631 length:5232 start_codon:yes stop_codon:yes gene_type:complete